MNLTFASKNCTIQTISTMFTDDVTANELFSSFELWISREGDSLMRANKDVRGIRFFRDQFWILAIFDKNV